MSWGLWGVHVRVNGRTAVADVTLQIGPGMVVAVVGGDGAGKTTTLKVASGLLVPDAGSVRHPPRERIGVTLELPGVYRDLTVGENVDFTADAYGLPPASRDRRAVSCCSVPTWARHGIAWPRTFQAACGRSWRSCFRCCTHPTCLSSTSRPPGWTRSAAQSVGG